MASKVIAVGEKPVDGSSSHLGSNTLPPMRLANSVTELGTFIFDLRKLKSAKSEQRAGWGNLSGTRANRPATIAKSWPGRIIGFDVLQCTGQLLVLCSRIFRQGFHYLGIAEDFSYKTVSVLIDKRT